MLRQKGKSGKRSPRARKSQRPELSVVVPFFNEAEVIYEFHRRMTEMLTKLRLDYEIVCVDDGSRDSSLEKLRALHIEDARVKIVSLSRNFGKDIALTAGLDAARGELILPIDADLQDPPEMIPELVEKIREGYDMVYAVRTEREGETWLKKITANLFYRIIKLVTKIDIPENAGDFRIFNRRVADAIAMTRERHRFMKGIFSWVGFRHTGIEYVRFPRQAGNTKWNYWKLWNFAIEGIISFSSFPLRIWSYVGVGISAFAFLYAGFLIVRTLTFGIDLPGYASLMVAILFIGGIQLTTLGIIGEYLGRVFEEVKRRPLYIVREHLE